MFDEKEHLEGMDMQRKEQLKLWGQIRLNLVYLGDGHFP